MASASSLFPASHISTAPRIRTHATPFPLSPARPSLRFRQQPPAVAAALQAEHQPAVAAAPKPPALPFRVGHGFDLHRLEPGLPLIIGGISIPHDRGCEAHSDGDVLLHCVVDAILGALGLPDIGQIFPDTDPKWKGAESSVFMREAVSKADASSRL
ncbi:unnamed protein product [Alopecurus aequalis]